MNVDSWDKIFNFYWESETRSDETDFYKKLCTVCLKPSIDLICSDEIATSELISYIDFCGSMGSMGQVGQFFAAGSEKYAHLDRSYELFQELTEDVGYLKPKYPTKKHEWENYSFDECPMPDWFSFEIESVINKYLALNVRHPMLDRILLKAFADFEVCSTLRDITYKQYGGKSHLEREEASFSSIFSYKGEASVYFCLFVSFISVVYFVTADLIWGDGFVISILAFVCSLTVATLIPIKRMLKMMIISKAMYRNTRGFGPPGPWNSILEGEKIIYESAYHSGFISVERLYTSFEEASALGVAVEQDVWALLSDIKSRETILPNF